MKKRNKIFSILLALTLGIFTGCTDESSTSSGNNSNNGNMTPIGNGAHIEYNVTGDVEGTVHERFIGTTEYKILDNGVTDYKIVTPSQYGSDLTKTVAEFNSFFEEATGIKLTVISDLGLTYEMNGKYISLGKTNLLETSGVEIDYETLKHHGYEVVTKGATLFVAGEERGVLYGVYDILEYLIGYKCYTPTYYKIDKNVKNIDLPAFDIKEVPDFDYRIAPNGNYLRNPTVLTRMRMNDRSEVFVDSDGNDAHTAFNILPPEIYKESHPDWYMGNGAQLCYTARGNETEYEALVAESVERCKYFLDMDKNQSKTLLAFTQIDQNTWCDCEACSALVSANGNTGAATQIPFINDVAAAVEMWIQSDEAGRNKGRDITFVIFAYHKTDKAPTVKNADGTWSLTSPEMQLRDNVAVWVAPLHYNYVESIYSPNNVSLKTIFDSWSSVAPTYCVWGYDVYFSDYLTPFDSWNTMQELAKYLYNLNTKIYWPQGAFNDLACTNFDNLKSFVWSEMLWNVNVNMNELIDEYFSVVYREAGDMMKAAYWQMRTELLRQRVELERPYSVYTVTSTADYYSKQYLLDLLDQMSSAREFIDKYKVLDPEYYETVMTEITLETCSPLNILLSAYSDTYNKEDLKALVAHFTECVNKSGITKKSELGNMTDFLKSFNK